MARVLFAWELGGGLGHLVRYRSLILSLLADGHDVSFYGGNPLRAATVFAETAVRLGQAPRLPRPSVLPVPRPNSYPEILLNCGYHDAGALTGALRRWVNLIEQFAPTLVIADYAPAAVLACRALGQRVVVSGSGFFVPPRVTPLPPLRYWLAADRASLARHEARLLGAMNEALRALEAPSAPSVADAVLGDASLLLSFAEFDHCYAREEVDYLGAWPSAGFGLAPEWPATGGQRVFAYLDRRVLLPEILAACAAVNASLCLYAPGLEATALPAELATRVWLASGPVNLARAAIECDACITNGNINSMMAFLLAGKPHLAVPSTLEKYLVARRLELLGAGLSAPQHNPGDLAAKLHAVLNRREFRRAAERFAARYGGENEGHMVLAMKARLDLSGA